MYIFIKNSWQLCLIWMIFGCLLISGRLHEPSFYRCRDGKISFTSKAPLEIIEARSKKLQGVIQPELNSFAWSVEMNTFEGFNSPMQREHFNENYLESKLYPQATFVGKIIEKVDFQQVGIYQVRAKGLLTVHGVPQERIIKCQLEVKKGRLIVKSNFTVPLSDHKIAIPKIVHQKIAEEVVILVEADLLQA